MGMNWKNWGSSLLMKSHQFRPPLVGEPVRVCEVHVVLQLAKTIQREHVVQTKSQTVPGLWFINPSSCNGDQRCLQKLLKDYPLSWQLIIHIPDPLIAPTNGTNMQKTWWYMGSSWTTGLHKPVFMNPKAGLVHSEFQFVYPCPFPNQSTLLS